MGLDQLYYGQYYKSMLSPILGQLDYALVRWVKRKYRRLKGARKKRGHGLKDWPGASHSPSFLFTGRLPFQLRLDD